MFETAYATPRFDCPKTQRTAATHRSRSMIPHIREFLKQHHRSEAIDRLGENDSLLRAGILDSTLMVELVLFLEQRFAISISDDDLTPENFESLASIERYLADRRGINR